MHAQSAFDVDRAYFDEHQGEPSSGRVRQDPEPRQVTKRREIHVTKIHREDGGGKHDTRAPRGQYVNHSRQDNHVDARRNMDQRDGRNVNYRDDVRGSRGDQRSFDDTDGFPSMNGRGGRTVNEERREVRHQGYTENPRNTGRQDGGRSARNHSDTSRGYYDEDVRSMDRRQHDGGRDYRDDSRHMVNHREDMNHVNGGMDRRYSADREVGRERGVSNGVREVRSKDWDQGQGQRQRSQERQRSRNESHSSSVREVSDHLDDIETLERGPRGKPLPGGKKFFRKVQNELEELREEWKDEVEKLTEMSLAQEIPRSAHTQGTNSFVDTSSGRPIFTALVDVSEFHPKSVEVDYDHLINKVSVKGRNMNGIGTMTKTFTQKVQLPRYADDQQLTTKLSPSGILKVEVPLLYYSPQQQHKGRDVKSFVNEVRTNQDGSQTLEILVNTGPGVRAKDLHVQVSEDRELLVTANKDDAQGRSVRKLLKRYNLPERADVDRIRSKMGKDGRLMVLVPLHRH